MPLDRLKGIVIPLVSETYYQAYPSRDAMLLNRLLAEHRNAYSGGNARLYFVKVTLVVAFLFPMLITKNIWLGATSRFYALTPVLRGMPEINYPLDHIIYTAMLVLLALIALLPRPRAVIIAFVALTTTYTLWDQTRWMPYTYQFLVMFAVVAGCRWQQGPLDDIEKERNQRLLCMLGLILISIWFWSGVHKINIRYMLKGYPWMLSPFLPHLPETVQHALLAFAVVTPFIESGAAVMLLFPRTRVLGVLLLTSMHLGILVVFGPLGLNFNRSVWSWNVAQIAFVFFCFWKRTGPHWRNILWSDNWAHRVILFFFLCMPIGSPFGIWDDFLSHKLYSWSTKEAEIDLLKPEVEAELPEEVTHGIRVKNGRRFVHVLKWSYHVFESPPYHAYRVFNSIFAKLCDNVTHREDLELRIFGNPSFITGITDITKYRCGLPGQAPVEMPKEYYDSPAE